MAKKTTTENKMMQQFNNLKAKHPDAILLFRCGDFYETYEEDAKVMSEILGITLTKRANEGIAMVGFPYYALDTYLPKLIRARRRVAICDQLDQPKTTTKKMEVVEEVKPAETPVQSANDKQPEDMTIAELMAEYKRLREENEALKVEQGCSAIEVKEAEERASRESDKAQHWMERAQRAEAKLEAIKGTLNG